MIFIAQWRSVTKTSVESQFGYCLLLWIFCGRKPNVLTMHILMRGHRKQGTEGTQCAFFMFIRDFVVFWRKLFYESSGGNSLMTWENPTAFYCEIKGITRLEKLEILVHERPCSLQYVQAHVVYLVISCLS